MNQRITITVNGEGGKLSPFVFMTVLKSTLAALDHLKDSVLSDDEEFSGWTIDDLSKVNPATVTLSSSATVDLVYPFLEGFRRLEKEATAPAEFNVKVLRATRQIVSVLGHGAESLTFRNGQIPGGVTPTLHAAANIDEVLGERYYESETTLYGRLDLISVKGHFRFSVLDESYSKDVRCEAEETLFEDAKTHLGHRVAVHGTVRFNKLTDAPVSVEATKIELMPDDTGGFESMPKIDMTKGESSESFIRRMRNGS